MSLLLAGSILGAAGLSSAGALYANQQNLKNTNKWNDVSVDLANTAHQREVLDLKAAGLNPVLSASGSGASVPSLGAAHMDNPAQGLADGMSTAANYMSSAYKAQVANTRANTEAVNLQNSALSADRRVMDIQRDMQEELALTERDATLDFLGHKTRMTKKGPVTTFDPKQYEKAKGLYKEALQSDIKNRANANLRNWISTGANAVNSASGVIRAIKK